MHTVVIGDGANDHDGLASLGLGGVRASSVLDDLGD
jgi:hypothetical protein